MQKRIFSEEEQRPLETKPKQEFSEAEVVLETESEASEQIIEQSLKPSRFWLRLFLAALVLFGVATVAQSVQWLYDSVQAKAWIELAFAIAFFVVSLTGVGVIVREWRKLVWLRRHHLQKQQSEQLLLENLPSQSGEMAVDFCKQISVNFKQHPTASTALVRWQAELDPAYNAKEVLYLFGETVLSPIDNQVKKMISRYASENALIVAVSPLAVADVLMTAWRNIAMVNQISRAYGMELGYLSRLKLFKMVLTNMIFAGATEVVSDVGMEYFSQSLTAKLSLRAAQGIGVGLLTARLGIKAMEFCRPIAFVPEQRPKLSAIRQELLTSLKTTLFSKSRETETAELASEREWKH